MYRRYRAYRQRRRRTTQRRPRSIMKRPGVQIAILIIVALVIYLLLQSGGSGSKSLPDEFGMREANGKYQSEAFVLDIRMVKELHEWRAMEYTVESRSSTLAGFNAVTHRPEGSLEKSLF